MDVGKQQLSLQTDKGETLTLATTGTTVIVHVPPGETDVKKGTKMAFSELASGDRVVAFARPSDDPKILQATSLVVRTNRISRQSGRASRKTGRNGASRGSSVNRPGGSDRYLESRAENLESAAPRIRRSSIAIRPIPPGPPMPKGAGSPNLKRAIRRMSSAIMPTTAVLPPKWSIRVRSAKLPPQ